MKHDLEFTKKILSAVEDYDKAVIPLHNLLSSELLAKGEEEKFILHVDICIDRGFLEIKNLSKKKWYSRDTGGNIHWASPSFRLTALGHDFLFSINEPKIWEVLKSNFKESSIDTIKTVAKDLAINLAKEKISKYIEPTHK